VGQPIADCQLPIFDWRLVDKANWQSEIANRQLRTHPLPRGGTDFIGRDCNSDNQEDENARHQLPTKT